MRDTNTDRLTVNETAFKRKMSFGREVKRKRTSKSEVINQRCQYYSM